MHFLKTIYQFLLEKVDFRVSANPMRIIVVAAAIICIVTGVRIWTTGSYSSAQLQDVNRKFEQKNKALMIEVMNRCEGDLGNPEVVQSCLSQVKAEMIKPIKKARTANIFSGIKWFVFWGLFITGYIYILAKQNGLRSRQIEIDAKRSQESSS